MPYIRGGYRIFLRRGAPLGNDVTDGEVKKIKSEYLYTKKKASSQVGEGGGSAHPQHPPPTSALVNHDTNSHTERFSFT